MNRKLQSIVIVHLAGSWMAEWKEQEEETRSLLKSSCANLSLLLKRLPMCCLKSFLALTLAFIAIYDDRIFISFSPFLPIPKCNIFVEE